jgi:putative RecB family exonuclease
MALELPTSLSPSKVSTFTDCALSFRFSAIDRIPQPPTVATVRGTLVHSTLERLLTLDASERTTDTALDCLADARVAIAEDPEWTELALDPAAEAVFMREADVLVHRYFDIEDPTDIDPIGLELPVEFRLPFEDGTSVLLRGIIDRLERDADGGLVVSDYKTGKPPSEGYQQSRLTGVHFYAFLCEQIYDERPSKVQLLYLGGTPAIVETTPTEQSTRQIERKIRSIWSAIETACEREDFRPKKSRLCDWCAYQTWCPAFGGDPAEARVAFEGTARRRGRTAFDGPDRNRPLLP